jgi:phosphate/phosphite/phosphonate ABC transporter binding protein
MSRQPGAKSERASRIEPITRLATGGMADIWLSREVGAAGLERLVVVKRLLPHLSRDPEIVDMFVSEARFVARLVHPNVVQIHDLGEDDEGYFLVMEYVAGCSVSELLSAALGRRARLRLAAALCVAEQGCAGAHAAHELCDPTGKPLGLVHRDISPHNLMVGPSGEVKLLDFGIAKATAAAEATRTGSLKGKHGYMSPEQCAGEHLDRRSDVFALGIVCWELFTGVRLFKRETEYATMHAIVNGEFRAPSAVRPDLPPALDEVLAKALTVDPEKRWQTADALRRALLHAAEDSGVRPSRDALIGAMKELLGARLEERERALREAATSGRLSEAAAVSVAPLRQPDGSGPTATEKTGDGGATLVLRRQAAPSEGPAGAERGSGASWPNATSGPVEDEATRVDGRPAPHVAAESAPLASAHAPQPAHPHPAQPTERGPTPPAPRASNESRGLWLAVVLGLLVAVLAFVAVVLVSKPQGETAAAPAASPTSAPSPAPPLGPPLRFAVAPTVDQAVLRSEFAPFLTWLGHTLGRPVELTIAESYDDTGSAVASGRADFALLPPLLLVRALAREPRLQPVTVRLFDGSRASDGYVLVRDDSTLTQAAELRGRRLCYVDRASTTGYLLPRIWLRKAGLVPDRDVETVLSGDHIAAMRDLLAGKCDGAAVYSGAYLTARKEGIAVGRMRVLAITGRVPQDAMVATPNMGAEDLGRLRAALLGFEPHRDIDAGRIGEVLGITGFAEFHMSELEVIREAAEAEGLLPRADGG